MWEGEGVCLLVIEGPVVIFEGELTFIVACGDQRGF